jgi:hypothetical protein
VNRAPLGNILTVRENKGLKTMNDVTNSMRPMRHTVSSAQQQAQQRADAERLARQKAGVIRQSPAAPPQTTLPAVVAKSTAVAVPDNRDYRSRYLDEIAPSTIVGRLIKFGKDGKFVTNDDGEPISEDTEFIALCDETLVGWIKVNGENAPPDRHQGLLYDGYEMPARESLGDTDQAQWELGLSGQPQDPWAHQMCVVLQHCDTKEMFTFSTQSVSGRRAVGNLLRHYERMQRGGTNEYPVVRLKPGGFNHRDDRIGWVPVLVFVAVGRAPRDRAQRPDTSLEADLSDSIGF